ncbi:hypothetical protein ACSBR2_001325 [Camellia fascicularis]
MLDYKRNKIKAYIELVNIVKRDQSEAANEYVNDLESNFSKAFKVYDLIGDDFISCEELQNVLSRLGLWNEYCVKDCKYMINV